MNNPYIEEKLKAIHSILASYLHSGKSNQSKGNEREFVINQFLSQILPPQFRFGQGEITDKKGSFSNHCDIIVELPFFLRLNVPTTSQSLYLSEDVGVVIEVKSDLGNQWNEVLDKVGMIKSLDRELRGQSVTPAYWVNPLEKIPVYVISFTGWKKKETLIENLQKCDTNSRPDGVLIIDSGLFCGTKYNVEGVWSLYIFIAEILLHLRGIINLHTDPFDYCRDLILPPTTNQHSSMERF